MRRLLPFLLFAGCCSISAAQDTIRLPMTPGVVPEPGPVAGAVDKLQPDSLYIVTADVALIILQSPDGGLVKITAVPSPMSVFAKFADGTGQYEFRTYDDPHIYALSPIKSGTCELLLIPQGVERSEEIVRQRLTVSGVGPNPPPGPGPDPEPQPTPDGAKRVLIVHESSKLSTLPPSQAVLLSSAVVLEYLDSHCSVGPDGVTPERRIWDQDVDLTNVPQVWKDAMALKRGSLPWIIVSNGKTGYSGPLPVTQAELMTLLKKYLGE